jgi:hypothetical protein
MPADPSPRPGADDEPDPRLLWRWVGAALRPWIGWIFLGAGAFLMLLGYLGVSRESIVEKQVPYLVSGGIGGVFLAVIGAYFLATQELRADSGRLDRLERMVEELHGALLTRADAPPPPANPTRGAEPAPSSEGRRSARRVVAVEGGETFHRADCALVAGKAGTDLTAAAARKRDLRPCPVCDPAPAAAAS